MKHIQSINEWFGSKLINKLDDYKFFGDSIISKKTEMDKFLENITKVIKDENIKISYQSKVSGPGYTFSYIIIIDDKKYVFEKKYSYHLLVFNNKTMEEDIEISEKDYRYIENLYQNQKNKEYELQQIAKKKETEEKIRKLTPEITDVGRAAKKYNL